MERLRKSAVLVAALAAIAFAQVGAAAAQDTPPRPGVARDRNLDQRRMFYAAGQLYSLDPDLLAAIAKVESGGDSDAVSPKGAQGLMQLMPATASRFRVLDPFDPVSNTLGAARFINYLRQYRIDNGQAQSLSLPEMLAAYNAGEGAVQKYGGIPPYPETRDYVRKVLLAYLFGNARSDLATRLRAAGAPPQPALSHAAPAPAHRETAAAHQARAAQKPSPREPSPIDKLTEIQRLRAQVVSRHESAGRHGEQDAVR